MPKKNKKGSKRGSFFPPSRGIESMIPFRWTGSKGDGEGSIDSFSCFVSRSFLRSSRPFRDLHEGDSWEGVREKGILFPRGGGTRPEGDVVFTVTKGTKARTFQNARGKLRATLEAFDPYERDREEHGRRFRIRIRGCGDG